MVLDAACLQERPEHTALVVFQAIPFELEEELADTQGSVSEHRVVYGVYAQVLLERRGERVVDYKAAEARVARATEARQDLVRNTDNVSKLGIVMIDEEMLHLSHVTLKAGGAEVSEEGLHVVCVKVCNARLQEDFASGEERGCILKRCCKEVLPPMLLFLIFVVSWAKTHDGLHGIGDFTAWL